MEIGKLGGGNRLLLFMQLIETFNKVKILESQVSYESYLTDILNHCKINDKKLNLICDANPEKFGKYTPGSNIKIISKENMRKLKPDYLFILIWSFRKEVIKQEEKYIKNGGKLVFHLPKFHIIDKNNYKKYLKKDLKSFAYKI